MAYSGDEATVGLIFAMSECHEYHRPGHGLSESTCCATQDMFSRDEYCLYASALLFSMEAALEDSVGGCREGAIFSPCQLELTKGLLVDPTGRELTKCRDRCSMVLTGKQNASNWRPTTQT